MKKFTYILSLLFVMSLIFTGCTKLDVIDPAGDVEQQDYRGIDGDELDDDGASTGWVEMTMMATMTVAASRMKTMMKMRMIVIHSVVLLLRFSLLS